jgi:hypothetical protein
MFIAVGGMAAIDFVTWRTTDCLLMDTSDKAPEVQIPAGASTMPVQSASDRNFMGSPVIWWWVRCSTTRPHVVMVSPTNSPRTAHQFTDASHSVT